MCSSQVRPISRLTEGGASMKPKGRLGARRHASRRHGRHRTPLGPVLHGAAETAIERHDRVRRPGDQLFGRDVDDAALLAQALDDIDAADALDDFRVDRAARAGLESLGPAREIDAGALFGRHLRAAPGRPVRTFPRRPLPALRRVRASPEYRRAGAAPQPCSRSGRRSEHKECRSAPGCDRRASGRCR